MTPVTKVNAAQFKHRVGAYLDEADFTPILITKHGREKSVLISKRQYDHLIEIEKRHINSSPK